MTKVKMRLVIALVLSFALFCGAGYSYASSLDDVLNKIDDTEDKLYETEEQIEELGEEITELQNAIEDTEQEIQALEVKIQKKQSQLTAKKKEIQATTDDLNARLRQMYKSGSVSFVDILFSSGNISEFITNMEMISLIYESDKDLVKSLKVSYKKIEKQKQELDALKSSLDLKQGSLNAGKAAIAQKREVAKKEGKKLEAQLDSLNQEADRLVEEIRNNSGGGDYSGGILSWPCPGYTRVTSEFGYRIHPILGYKKLHTGIDIGAPYGASVIASNSGRVMSSYYNSSYGNVIIIDHGGGIVTLYAHLSSRLVSEGGSVTRGQTIGKVGSTGMSTGAHLHFEVRVDGVYVNPRSYL